MSIENFNPNINSPYVERKNKEKKPKDVKKANELTEIIQEKLPFSNKSTSSDSDDSDSDDELFDSKWESDYFSDNPEFTAVREKTEYIIEEKLPFRNLGDSQPPSSGYRSRQLGTPEDSPSPSSGYRSRHSSSGALPRSEYHVVEHEKIAKQYQQERTQLELKGISFDKDAILQCFANSTIANKKAEELKKAMPLISDSEAQDMAGFIELNRAHLHQLSDKNDVYLRREVTGLPMSLFITSKGNIFWMLKKKGSQNPMYFRSAFKIIQEGIEHDSLKQCAAGTMKIKNESARDSAQSEIQFGSLFQNTPNIAQVLGTIEYKSKSKLNESEHDKILVVGEYYSNGDLADVIDKLPLSEETKDKIVQGVINGGYEIHEKEIVHGDFRPENIFLDNDFTPHIGDFGCCHRFNELPQRMLEAYTHPHAMTASDEELLMMQPKYDVYAMGLALAKMELKIDTLPWESHHPKGGIKGRKSDNEEMVENGLNEFYNNFPVATPRQRLIKKLIHPNINKIPTMEKAKALSENIK